MRNLIAGIFLILLAAASARADSITLRGSVRLSVEGGPVRLADVAVLVGDDAKDLGDVVILDAVDGATGAQEVTIDQVRQKLTEAGAHWGRINLSGSRVTLRPSGASAVGRSPGGRLEAMTSARIDHRQTADAEPEALAADVLARESTLRGAIAAHVARAFGADPRDLRLILAGSEPGLLSASADRYAFELEPITSARGDRIELAMRLWNDGAVHARESVTIRPLQRTVTTRAAADVPRGRELAAADLTAAEEWLSPTDAADAIDSTEAAGHVTRETIRAGELIRRRNLRPVQVVHRGDRVIVRCLVGGVIIAVHAEALDDGARGQSIEFRKLGERQSFLASVAGPGEAVVDLRKP
jgi:flagella basal body P-ring formation protein FlgA